MRPLADPATFDWESAFFASCDRSTGRRREADLRRARETPPRTAVG
ncbi:MAG: hypothetical protein P4L85_18640 [Paludisphaera borealis]|nr:hypothetical protein [Paludisphaera borealis]MDR3621376.1 hypothetical protein [Paludisphaera borealis]